MKRFGIFLLGLTPTIIALAMSVSLSVAIGGVISGFFFVFGDQNSFTSLQNIFNSGDIGSLAMLIYSIYALVAFGCWFYASYEGYIELRPNPATSFHPYQTLGIVLLIPGTQVASSIIVSIIASLSPTIIEAYDEMMDTAGLGGHISILMFLYAVLLGPITEELIFRGVTLRIYRRILPFWAANFMQALLFGIFHMNLVQGCYAFTLGLLLGYICYRGKSIYLSILMHILFNFFGSYAPSLLNFLLDNAFGDLFFLGMGILSLTFGIRFFRKGTLRKNERLERIHNTRIRCIHLS